MKNVTTESIKAGAKREGVEVKLGKKDTADSAAEKLTAALKGKFGEDKLEFQCENCEMLIPDVGFCPFCGADLGGGGAAGAEETPAEGGEGEESGAEGAPEGGAAAPAPEEKPKRAPRAKKDPAATGEEAKALADALRAALPGCEFEERTGYIRVVFPGTKRVRFIIVWKRNGKADFFTLDADTLPAGEQLVQVSEEERKAKHLGQMSHRYTGDSSKEVVALAQKALKFVKAADAQAQKDAEAAAKAEKEKKAAEKAAAKAAPAPAPAPAPAEEKPAAESKPAAAKKGGKKATA